MEGVAQKVRRGLISTLYGVCVNLGFAVFKISIGVVGQSYALIADGIESLSDVVSSIVVYLGLIISKAPPDKNHPYGHGKAEAIAGMCVATILLIAATVIVYQSLAHIREPHAVPKAYTLIALAAVIVIKEGLARYVKRVGVAIGSCAVQCDAWHHRSDALTSLAAFVGISIALIGGPRYAAADDWAALAACLIIYANGFALLKNALNELMDLAPPEAFMQWITTSSLHIAGVKSVNECRVRKSGLAYWVDLHIGVDAHLSVREGHAIAHTLANSLQRHRPDLANVLIHVEPYEPQSSNK